MKRVLFLIFFICFFVRADILEPNQAFMPSVNKDEQFVHISIKLADDIYLYKDSFALFINNVDDTKFIDFKKAEIKEKQEVYFNEFSFSIPLFKLEQNNSIVIYYQGCSMQGLCYQPLKSKFNINNSKISVDYINKQANKKEENLYEESLNSKSFFIVIFSFFLAGLLLSLTPCTLPMIPILSSILANLSSKRTLLASIIYVLGTSLTYTISGVIAALLGSGLQEIFQSKIVIIIFSLIFVLFAVSMFGFFNIQMPNSMQNSLLKINSKQSGFVGIFIMGALSALIVGPCVAAPLATLLIYIANTKDVFLGASALFTMSIAMSIPLIVIGFGFKFLKSGAWMQVINKIFAFIMLVMAVYFLGRILSEEITNILYALICFASVIYFGLFDEIKSKFAFIIKYILLLIFVFALYLTFSVFMEKNNAKTLEFKIASSKEEMLLQDKNLIYFTADWCENCKELAKTTFKDERVINKLSKINLIKIDLSDVNDFEKELTQKYQIFGPPVMMIVDKNMNVENKIIGYVDANTFLKKINF
ncbi:protein-disulfide reductase DsbD [Campylobacter canadensis]|uniref:protein-disulfide reductase DsbD n=1 Tax=Campylobacter canadensis TaxID=449520 RepID=UPI001CCD6329|nr:protein-disulfide reductase DsbD [Campylobacter canadensis]MBZ7994534.1 protein-disulfide reductase DsbD [Campylobacter canadensis]MBZ7997109.1 protein-disulfide reductase DsbD [Campylobacter canadensis]MBZ7999865.1 protein-disulfide reductase DsbD [Campylobacter canadensis]MBZ8004426.1 protein-disulfide reductase DsbD [Campylobacter canadensis]